MDPNKVFKQAYDSYLNKDYVKSENLYKKLIKAKPDIDVLPTLYYNLGLALMSQGKYSEAVKVYDISNRYKLSDETTWNKCLCLFNLKDWKGAISIASSRYGNSRNSNTSVSFPKFPIEQIKDAYLAKDKKILVMNEQGLGDELLFTTQLIKLDEIVKSATVQVSKDTIDLLNNIYKFKNITLSCFDSISYEEVETYDTFIALGDMFYSLYKFGAPVSSREFISLDNKKIGVCWSTNRKSPNSDERSIDPKKFNEINHLNLVSLQYGEGYGKYLNLPDYLPSNILETWNKLDELDIVVTVDTMVAHLAGLKSIPTLLIMNKYKDWRWKYRDKEDDRYSMFYPMIEIIDINDNLIEILEELI